jgi:ribonuclease R
MLTGGDKPSIKDYAALIEKIKGRPDEHLLQTVLLRSMQQAVYSPDNIGHLVWLMRHMHILPLRYVDTLIF